MENELIFIIEQVTGGVDAASLKEGKKLSESGVDSLDFANVLLMIEEKYEIKIPDEDMDELTTLSEIEGYIRKKLN